MDGTPFRLPSIRRLLCLGAHADDIEIGCGGTILGLTEACPGLAVRWIVLSASDVRAAEARASAAAFLAGAERPVVEVHGFRDGHFPSTVAAIKELFETVKAGFDPDLVLTHHRADLHQDHRVVSDLTWNTWRRHPILEYEIPKYDGDWQPQNVFVPLTTEALDRKVDLLMSHFPSQRDKSWFTPETFRAVARLRGVESAARTGYAEAFTGRKVVLEV